jgi:hypothetical protein
MLLLLLRCVGDQIFSTTALATVGVAKQQMHISFCIALSDLVSLAAHFHPLAAKRLH